MLIPAIDLKGGKVVQLVQGERVAVETTDLDYWIERFKGFPRVNVIDLDAAKNAGTNNRLVREICRRLPCQVGGGIRTPDKAIELCAMGAVKVIAGSALFQNGRVNVIGARRFHEAVGLNRLIGAVDSKGGKVVINGWSSATSITAIEAVCALEPYCGEFLYTHVDKEGLMAGTDFAAITAVRNATKRPLIAAGGITTQDEIDRLHRMGVDAVVGMAIYTGALDLTRALSQD